MIRAEEVSYAVNGSRIVDGVSLEVEAGEFVGIIGPNGAGKTTLLKLLGGVLPATSGTVRLHNQSLIQMKPRAIARTVAMVPQDTRLDFSFSVRQVVLMGRHPHLGRFDVEGPQDFALVEQAMAQLEIADLADRTITTLSGGERQRVFLAKALAAQPQLLLLDEPIAALDLRHQFNVLSLLKRLSRANHAVVVVLHDLNLAARFCDRLALIHAGQLAGCGAPADVLNEDVMRRVYRIEAVVRHDPLIETISITALQQEESGEQ
ncbi:MAG: heme ABC transporter ATP-binding protein [Chloroflexi bacterium]|nr:heme ABC transporter ATP-binding protein [Chloroflexota bacterium]